MPQVFLSHSFADKPFVRCLAARLAESGARVWFDEAELKVGDSLVDRITDAIQKIDFVIVVISRHSVKSKWAKKEISLALAKEIARKKIVVLPAVIDDCDVPPSLADKLYADFRDDRNFEASADKLLRSMGLRTDREYHRTGIAVEWTDEGPRIIGPKVVISPSESNALLDRWRDWLPRFTEQERKKGRSQSDIGQAAQVLAVLRACADTYARVPSEEEMQKGTTELGRKFNLLFLFFKGRHQDAVNELEQRGR